MLWVVMALLPLLMNQSDDKLLLHTPKDAFAIVSVNNRKIIERFMFDALYAKGFSENELEQLEYNTEEVNISNSGIDLRENVVIFQSDYKKATLTGFIFKITNQTEFSSFELRGKNEIKYFNDEIGCILLLPQEYNSDESLRLEQYAKGIVLESRNDLPEGLLQKNNDERLINFFYGGGQHSYIHDLELAVRIEDNSIFFEGKGIKNPEIKYQSGTYSQIRKPGIEPYLEIRAGQLPDSVYSYFDVITREFNVELPKVTSQQLFFYGFKIDNINGSTAFLPKFDGVFRFADSINVVETVDSLCAADHKIHKEHDGCIRVGEVHYHYKQLSPFEIVAGITNNLELEEINKAPLPLIQGNPAATINFEGEGIIAQIAQMLPPVKYSKKLFNDLEYFEIHTENEDDEQLLIKGQMRFPKEKTASLEIFKYLMKF